MAWNDVFDQDTDWSAISFLAMFYEAMDERSQAIGDAPGAWGTAPAAGDDVQYVGVIGTLQGFIESNAGFFLQPGDYEGRTADSLPGISIAPFTRKYPREFATLGSTEYTDTTTFVVGHKARCIADAKVYQRIANQSGVESWNGVADLIPDTVTASGVIQAGDYIGYWLFNEIRDALNLMRWVSRQMVSGLGFSPSTGDTYAGSGTGSSPSNAKADAVANYVLTGSGASGSHAGASSSTGLVGGVYSCQLHRRAYAPHLPGNGGGVVPTFAQSACDFWVWAFQPDPLETYDDNGDDVLFEQWHLNHTGTPSNTSTRTGTVIGSSAAPAGLNHGYRTVYWAVIRWDVAGGFQYLP